MTRTEYLEAIDKVIQGVGVPSDFPATAPVVAMFLTDFMPGDPDGPSGDNMTSYEIAQALEDTCQLSTTDVALVMVHLGYRLVANDYRGHEWRMRAVDPTEATS